MNYEKPRFLAFIWFVSKNVSKFLKDWRKSHRKLLNQLIDTFFLPAQFLAKKARKMKSQVFRRSERDFRTFYKLSIR